MMNPAANPPHNPLAPCDHCRDCGKPIAPLPYQDALCTECRYKPGGGPAVGWRIDDEYERAILTAAAPAAAQDDDDPAPEPADGHREALARFLRAFATGTVTQAGGWIHAVIWIAGLSGCRSQREYARRLNISAPRFSQILAGLPSDLRAILNYHPQIAKPGRFKCRRCKTPGATKPRL